MAISTLPQDVSIIGLEGSLTSHLGQLLVRLGRPAEGVEWLKKSHEIRSRDDPCKPRESAWAAGNAADGFATVNDYPEAIKWQELARDHWLEWSNVHSPRPGSWPTGLKLGMAQTLTWAGQSQFKLARDLFLEAKQESESVQSLDWAFLAYIHFGLGTLDRKERSFEAAEAHFMEAQNLWAVGDQSRTDTFNAACMYRLGCVSLDQGKVKAAIKHLRDSIAVTAIRKTTMVAEHARCIFKLSEAMEQDPREEAEARRLREEAQRLLFVRDPENTASGSEITYDSLVNILWR